jgi:hypothetical protein
VTARQGPQPPAPQQRGRPDWRWWLTPGALLAVTVLGIAAIFWGKFVAPPSIIVTRLDAGPVAGFTIGDVRAYPDVEVFVVGLTDGRIRAIDARVRSSGCLAEWMPADERGSAANPLERTGAFVDPCSGAAWALTGDQVFASGDPEPLRTFHVTYDTLPDGVQHVFVEVIGREAPPVSP